MNTDTFAWSGDGSQPTPFVTTQDHRVSQSTTALVHWPGSQPHVAVVIIDGSTVGVLPRNIAVQIHDALRTLRIYANPIQVGLVVAPDGALALDLPMRTISKATAPVIKPTVHGAPQTPGWPEEAPTPQHPRIEPDPLPIRTWGDFFADVAMRVAGFSCLGTLAFMLLFLVLYILNAIF